MSSKIYNRESDMDAKVTHYEDGTLRVLEILDSKGRYHNDNGPAFCTRYPNGQEWSRQYFLHGKEHREDGPAYKRWHSNGQECCRQHCLCGEFHREDGPAYQCWDSDGQERCRRYYLHGEELSREEWEKRVQKKVKIEIEGQVKWISRESAETLGLI
jgi:hypothetical protein